MAAGRDGYLLHILDDLQRPDASQVRAKLGRDHNTTPLS
jgi:hypothetical protein